MRGEGREGQSPEVTTQCAIALSSWRRNSRKAPAPPPVSRRRGRRAGGRRGHAPENVEAVHSEIVSGARYAGGVRPGRGAAPEAPRRPRRICSSTSTSGAGEAREIARARVARRTWTLDALRAATEPVKVEAMQAILMFWRGVWCGAFAGMALRSREAVVYRRVATRFCQLGRFFARSISFVRRSSHVFATKTPRARRANWDDKIAPRHAKPFLEISKCAPNRSASREILLFGLISSGSRASGFSLSNARFRETGDR